MKITTAQIQKIHAILGKHGTIDPEHKAMLVRQFTSHPSSTSTKDLSFTDANMLIRHLGGTALNYENWGLFDYKKKQHRAVLSLCHQLNWVKNKRVDLVRLSEWLKSKSPVKKPLLKMQSTEVSKVIYALQRIISNGL